MLATRQIQGCRAFGLAQTQHAIFDGGIEVIAHALAHRLQGLERIVGSLDDAALLARHYIETEQPALAMRLHGHGIEITLALVFDRWRSIGE